MTDLPIAVITNGSLLYLPDVRQRTRFESPNARQGIKTFAGNIAEQTLRRVV